MRHLSPLPNVLIQTITQYLKSHRRLIIPQLGAFIVKVPGGEILFSELFRRDDGILRSLLLEQGMNELEAAGAIDRFAFEVRHAAQQGGEYRMEGFGTFSAGENGTLFFHRELQQQPTTEPTQATEPPRSEPEITPRVSASPKIQPDPSLKGLRYGRPQKASGSYRGKRRVDRFLIVAIAAAILAVAAIAYGYILSSQDDETNAITTEQLQTTTDTTPTNAPTEEIQQ